MEIRNYTGPADGESHYNARAARWLRPATKALVHTALRTHIEGLENLPQDGSEILCFTHQGYMDAPLLASLSDRDWRFMAAKEQFTGVIGKAMTAMGAFPVDRAAPGAKPLEVANGLLESDHLVALAPEGGIHNDGTVHKLKDGAAMMSLHSKKCSSDIPVAIDYQPHQVSLGEKIGTYSATAAVVAGGLAAASAASPVLRTVAGAITGALSGLAVGGVVGFAISGKKDMKDRGMDGLKGAGVGALAGGLLGGLTGGSLLAAAPLSLGAGLTTLALGKAVNARPEAYVKVGKPIEVQPFREMPNHKEARAKLTETLYNELVELKAGLGKHTEV